jgi:hypothetical protein
LSIVEVDFDVVDDDIVDNIDDVDVVDDKSLLFHLF